MNRAAVLHVRTHWTRVLYVDVFGRRNATSSRARNESLIDSKSARRSPLFEQLQSPLAMAGVLLAIYAALHLAVGGLLYALASPVADAAAAAARSQSHQVDAAKSRGVEPRTTRRDHPSASQ